MYSERDRRIFKYHDGQAEVFGDPLVIRRRLVQAAGGALDALVALAAPPEGGETADTPPAREAEARALEAQGKLLAVIRQAFYLPPFDGQTGGGCTEAMCWSVFDRFSDWALQAGAA